MYKLWGEDGKIYVILSSYDLMEGLLLLFCSVLLGKKEILIK